MSRVDKINKRALGVYVTASATFLYRSNRNNQKQYAREAYARVAATAREAPRRHYMMAAERLCSIIYNINKNNVDIEIIIICWHCGRLAASAAAGRPRSQLMCISPFRLS